MVPPLALSAIHQSKLRNYTTLRWPMAAPAQKNRLGRATVRWASCTFATFWIQTATRFVVSTGRRKTGRVFLVQGSTRFAEKAVRKRFSRFLDCAVGFSRLWIGYFHQILGLIGLPNNALHSRSGSCKHSCFRNNAAIS